MSHHGPQQSALCILTKDALIIGISRLSAVLPIISIGQLVSFYQPIVVYTVGKCKFSFLIPKVDKHESGIPIW